jgi:deazaflavin-dependent oxidoreductase (nitroreductase family)
MSYLLGLARRLGHRPWFAHVGRRLVFADRLIGRLSRGRIVALALVPSLLITTTGRRTGQPRTTPLLYVPDGDAFVVTGSNWGQPAPAGWALNLLADPAASVNVKGTPHQVTARLAEGPERERLWRLLVREWPAFETYLTRAGGREIPVFRLEPRQPPP